ncbi:hypothetical protein QBC46DRAFT_376536 [Diplogelasinospora grovesii]|uniref:SigF-like NTF2-like domain-containing protein n=1 Tax=Diplogelasinospora grovesii TaxID=303347 RepID=A0AAN6NEB5_9PEZI|nr:hypothetical protein QBC46DRAFT_376536 [Diplogelasinospora grovesii]
MENPVKEIEGVVRALTQGNPREQQEAVSKYFLPGAEFVHPFCRVPGFEKIKVPGLGWEVNSRMLVLAVFKWYKILSPKIEIEIKSCVWDEQNSLLYVKMFQIFQIWFFPFHKAPVNLVTVLKLVPQSSSSEDTDDHHHAASEPDEHGLVNSDCGPAPIAQNGGAPSFAAVVATGSIPEAKQQEHHRRRKSSTGSASSSSTAAGDNHPTHTHTNANKQSSQVHQRHDQEQSQQGKKKKYVIQKQEDLYQINEFVQFLFSWPAGYIYDLWQLYATFLCVIGVMIFSPVMRLLGSPGVEKTRQKLH